MRRAPWIRSAVTAASALVLTILAPSAAQAGGPLEGRWRLTEQYYGEGGRNLALDQAPLIVTLIDSGARVSGTVRLEAHVAAWPAYFGPDGARATERLVVDLAPDRRSVSTRFRVPPGTGDDTSLLVAERWALDDRGRLLAQVEVTFEREGSTRGSFTWKRVFEREGEAR